MRISVVIPVYARQESAVRAIHSAVAQTGPWTEIVVVDDASPIPFAVPPDLARDTRIRVLRNERNVGASAARNAGVAAAQGNWIAFLDSDDIWLPDKIRSQAAFAATDQSQRPDPLVLYASGFRQINQRDGKTLDRLPLSSSDSRDFASGCWFSPGSTALVSRSAFDRIGGFDIDLKRLEDLDWALRLSLAGGSLKVAPFIGAVIEIGARPSFECIDTTCRQLDEKWTRDARAGRIPGLLPHLRAYLDVERAAVCRIRGEYARTLIYLARSFLRVPRLHVHLRRWWTEPPGGSSWSGAEEANEV
jgi:glycosyltransferase involved in cell wall biosynthesis